MSKNQEKELVDLLMSSSKQNAFTGYICRVTVKNDVPPQYKVSITGIASDFDYRDGTTYRDIDDPINVPSGGTARTESNDATKCVKTVFTGIRIVQQGFPPTALVSRADAQPDQCLVEVPIRLYIKPTLTESELKEGISKLLAIEVMNQ